MSNEEDKKKKNKLNDNFKKVNPFMIVIVVLIVWSVASIFMNPLDNSGKASEEISINETLALIQNGEVDKAIIQGNTVELELKNGEKLYGNKESQISFFEMLEIAEIDASKVTSGIYEEKTVAWVEIITNLAFPLIILGFLWWMFRQAGRSSGGLFSIGKSKAKLFSKEDQNKIGFDDVAGANETKDELVEIVDFLKHPDKYRKLGARIPKGVLLIGPSGVGKTLLARAIAGEASVPFYSVAGSEFIEMIVGVGSARVRDLFKMAKETSPSLIFIDEVDAIGRHRGKSGAVSNDEREQTLNQILVEMDGFDPSTNVIIIAATNRPDMLDPALVRPGRFDRHIRIDLPNIEERVDILKIHMKGKPFDKKVDIDRMSKQTVGFSGADIENMLNEAAILAARKDQKAITVEDISEAATKVKLGPGRKLLQDESQRRITAYHEAGHAVVSSMNPNSDPVSKITIVSRSMSLGHTQYTPQDDATNYTKSKLEAKIEALLGGRVAEELVFNEETIGASSDIERATMIARKMVTDFGMSKLGPINYVSDNQGLWDSSSEGKAVGYGDDVAREIDKEVKRIIEAEYEKAKKTLKTNRKMLDKLAEELLKRETLEQDEFEKVIGIYKEDPSTPVADAKSDSKK